MQLQASIKYIGKNNRIFDYLFVLKRIICRQYRHALRHRRPARASGRVARVPARRGAQLARAGGRGALRHRRAARVRRRGGPARRHRLPRGGSGQCPCECSMRLKCELVYTHLCMYAVHAPIANTACGTDEATLYGWSSTLDELCE